MSNGGTSRLRVGTSIAAVVLAVLALVMVATRLGSVGSDPVMADRIVPATPPAPPLVLPRVGALVDAEIQDDGTVRVTQWLRTARAISSAEPSIRGA